MYKTFLPRSPSSTSFPPFAPPVLLDISRMITLLGSPRLEPYAPPQFMFEHTSSSPKSCGFPSWQKWLRSPCPTHSRISNLFPSLPIHSRLPSLPFNHRYARANLLPVPRHFSFPVLDLAYIAFPLQHLRNHADPEAYSPTRSDHLRLADLTSFFTLNAPITCHHLGRRHVFSLGVPESRRP